jgi:hypothetical protein
MQLQQQLGVLLHDGSCCHQQLHHWLNPEQLYLICLPLFQFKSLHTILLKFHMIKVAYENKRETMKHDMISTIY